jgi:hypothetical protein
MSGLGAQLPTMNCVENQTKEYFSFQPPVFFEGGRKEKY